MATARSRLRLKNRQIDLRTPGIMGVLNTTPDSFSDGGRFLRPDAAVQHALRMVEEGAGIIDVGGESTRPGADRVDEAEQATRVVPVIEGIRAHSEVLISIDTTRAAVAAKALDAGADIVNDVSAGRDDPEILALAAEREVPVVLMHMLGEPRTMQEHVRYEDDDVVTQVASFLAERAETAQAAGVAADRIVIDPGIGFGKTVAHNLRLVRELDRLAALGYPVLLGVSRKSFIGALTGRAVEDRSAGTAAAVAAGVMAGAAILRIHDVAAMRDVVLVAKALRDIGAPNGEGQAVR